MDTDWSAVQQAEAIQYLSYLCLFIYINKGA